MTIFVRFAGISLVSFALFVGLSSFFLYQLFAFYTTITYIVEIDGRLLEGEKKVTSLFLSQLQYEKKYLILKDRQIHEQFRGNVRETSDAIDALAALAATPASKVFTKQIRASFDRYSSLVEEEFLAREKNRPYRISKSGEIKNALERDIFEKLELLEDHARQDSFSRITLLKDAVYEARNITLIIASFAFVTLIILSFYTAKSITNPIDTLIQKSRSIALGNLDIQRSVKSPPEIAELDDACYRMTQKLKQLEAMKSDFFMTMSHELRTPLTSINEGAKLLLEGEDVIAPDVRKRLATIISDQSERLIGLVSSLLDYSKMEAGMMPYHFRAADIGPLLEAVVEEYEPLAASRSIELTCDVMTTREQVKIDEERILQALRNLIGNSFRFTPDHGKILVTARVLDHELQVSVADTGCGIPEEDLLTIFDKYRQSGNAGRGKGTGLGLAIVKNIVTAHGGTIWVESTLGQGSTFTFSLPCS